jgi:hypothetical protein
VGEWHVIVGNVVEEMDFFLLQKETCGNRMNWRIPPAFVEESAILVEGLEEIQIWL